MHASTKAVPKFEHQTDARTRKDISTERKYCHSHKTQWSGDFFTRCINNGSSNPKKKKNESKSVDRGCHTVVIPGTLCPQSYIEWAIALIWTELDGTEMNANGMVWQAGISSDTLFSTIFFIARKFYECFARNHVRTNFYCQPKQGHSSVAPNLWPNTEHLRTQEMWLIHWQCNEQVETKTEE